MSTNGSDSHAFHPSSPEEQEAVRAQMERLLSSSHFRHSRRYPALLRQIVEETLAGREQLLKERTLGVEVFGRAPDYDTASDPIVRVTVAEIRKRIAQYYHEDAHGSELRIELTPGSYIPEFLHSRENEETPHTEEVAGAVHRDASTRTTPPAAVATPAIAQPRWPWFAGSAVALAIVMAVAIWFWQRPTAIDQLWGPLFAQKGPITFCLPMSVKKNGAGSAGTTAEAIAHALDLADTRLPASGTFYDHQLLGENVVYSDVLAMMKLEAVTEQQHRPVRVRLNLGTNLNDLREGPVIFLGGLDNQWTLELIDSLRYRFSGSDDHWYYILDTKEPGNQRWQIRLKDKMTIVSQDYAIIGRIHSNALGQTVMIAAGIGMSGTAAAGEFLADPARVNELRKRMGPALRDHDFEAVLQTDVVDGIAGPAQIVALDIR